MNPVSQPGHVHATAAEREACGCPHDPDEGASTGFLPISIAAVLLLCAWLFGLFG